jgi:hypothetical protein
MSNELFEEFSEDVRQKYNVPDIESYMSLNHKERNKMFYEVIKHHKICVIPSNTVESLDKMPRFQIIENNLNLQRRLPGKNRSRSMNIKDDEDEKQQALKDSEEQSKLLK